MPRRTASAMTAVSAIAPFWLVVSTAACPRQAPAAARGAGCSAPPRRGRDELRHVAEGGPATAGAGRSRRGRLGRVARLLEARRERPVGALDVEQERLGVAPKRVRELPEVGAHLGAVAEHLGGQLAGARHLPAGVLLG